MMVDPSYAVGRSLSRSFHAILVGQCGRILKSLNIITNNGKKQRETNTEREAESEMIQGFIVCYV